MNRGSWNEVKGSISGEKYGEGLARWRRKTRSVTGKGETMTRY